MKNHADRVWKIVKYENFMTSKVNVSAIII